MADERAFALVSRGGLWLGLSATRPLPAAALPAPARYGRFNSSVATVTCGQLKPSNCSSTRQPGDTTQVTG